MALQWDARDVKDAAAIGIDSDGKGIEWTKTEHIIFASMVTGLGKEWQITEANAAETFDRLSAFEHATDSPVRAVGDDYELESLWLTFDDIRARIGLRVNVSPVTRPKFERRLGEILMRDAAARRR